MGREMRAIKAAAKVTLLQAVRFKALDIDLKSSRYRASDFATLLERSSDLRRVG